MNLERIKDTIRKMLDLAKDDAATEGEIRNALNFAQKLMDQHNLSEEDLPDADNRLLEIERAECGQFNAFTGSEKVAMWERYLASFISKLTNVPNFLHHGTETVRKNGLVQLGDDGNARRARRYVFYGITEDAQFATQLYEELQITLATLARLKYGSVYRNSGRDYCEGFTEGLHSQLEQVQEVPSACTALVVKRNEIVEAKQRRAAEFIESKGIRLRKKSQRSGATSRDYEARESGRNDGSNYTVSNVRHKRISG